MNAPQNWGPSHQSARRHLPRGVWIVIGLSVFLSTPLAVHTPCGLLVVAFVIWRLRHRILGVLAVSQNRDLTVSEAWATIRAQAVGRSGVYLGVREQGSQKVKSWVYSTPERAVLLLGPPRSGKTSAVIIPTIISHDGPVLSTSTKPDVLGATRTARSQAGVVWRYDPTGSASLTVLDGVKQLRWSPLPASSTWDGALLMARAMVTGAHVGTGSSDATHWARRAQALLAPLLHAASLSGQSMEVVLDWISRHECDQAGLILDQAGSASRLAMMSLLAIANTEQRERASIFSSAADALEAYTSTSALDGSTDPNFDAQKFVTSRDSVFIHAPADRQGLVAPLVCGLLTEIRQATYAAHAAGHLPARVLFALDEVANIAPIPELPAIASEGGGQGVLLLAALQDLSQARARWGVAADGFLTLFGTKLLLPGVADPQTLEAVSTMLGEYDRTVISRNQPAWTLTASAQSTGRSTTQSTQRTRVLSAGEIANLPAGHGLHLDGVRWELLALTPAHTSEPWNTALTGASTR